jgi:hypothetical protein
MCGRALLPWGVGDFLEPGGFACRLSQLDAIEVTASILPGVGVNG